MQSIQIKKNQPFHQVFADGVGEIDGIITMSGTSGAGFKDGITNFKVVVSDGDNTSSKVEVRDSKGKHALFNPVYKNTIK